MFSNLGNDLIKGKKFFLSFPRRRESNSNDKRWIPTFVGMTDKRLNISLS
jgi:hypothetical protein